MDAFRFIPRVVSTRKEKSYLRFGNRILGENTGKENICKRHESRNLAAKPLFLQRARCGFLNLWLHLQAFLLKHFFQWTNMVGNL